MRYNFHTHSHLDDGKDTLENYVKAAIEKGVVALGFSAHAPLENGSEWCLSEDKLQEYCSEVRLLKEKYKGKANVHLGLEMDYIPGISEGFSRLYKKCRLEYNIGSVHLVKNKTSGKLWFIDGPEKGYKEGIEKTFNGDIKSAIGAFYEQSCAMIAKERPNIIGHLDKVKMHNKERFFSEREKWYVEMTDKLINVIADSNTIVELNTRGKYTGKTDEFFPSIDILQKCYMKKIPVMVNTDAHEPSQVNMLFDEATTLLKDIGFRETQTPFFKVKTG